MRANGRSQAELTLSSVIGILDAVMISTSDCGNDCLSSEDESIGWNEFELNFDDH